MKATINGITYEGSEEEIRRIVENPPNNGYPQINRPYPYWPSETPAYPTWPEEVPGWPYCPDSGGFPWGQRNWDGSPRVTCCIDGDFLC